MAMIPWRLERPPEGFMRWTTDSGDEYLLVLVGRANRFVGAARKPLVPPSRSDAPLPIARDPEGGVLICCLP